MNFSKVILLSVCCSCKLRKGKWNGTTYLCILATRILELCSGEAQGWKSGGSVGLD